MALGEFACQCGALFESDAGNRDERAYVGSAHAGMCAVVVAHVYELGGFLHAAHGGVENSVGFSHEGHYRAVGGLAGIHVEQLYLAAFLYGGGDGVDYFLVTSLRKVGDTLDDLFHDMFKL